MADDEERPPAAELAAGRETGLPRFVLVGVPKAGTTSLYHYLQAHPGVQVSPLEETNFLSYPGEEAARADVPWLRFPVTTLEQYRSLFADVGDRVAVDLSASCFGSTVAIERIQRFVPQAGLLLLLRDPVARAYSGYLHRVRKGYERRPVEEALHPGERAVDLGFYSQRLTEFRQAFGGGRVRVWLLEDLRQQPDRTMAEIFTYLGVRPPASIEGLAVHNAGSLPRSPLVHRLFLTQRVRRNVHASVPAAALRPARWLWRWNQAPPPTLPKAVELRLRALYRDDILRLQGILGRDLGSWLVTD